MSDDEKGYNGWTNYETWVTALWIDNDESTYNLSRLLVREATEIEDTADPDYAGPIVSLAADALKEWFEEDLTPFSIKDVEGVYADLIGAAVSEINWFEIAENYLEEVQTDA